MFQSSCETVNLSTDMPTNSLGKKLHYTRFIIFISVVCFLGHFPFNSGGG